VDPTQSTQILLVAGKDPQSPVRRILRDAGYPVSSASSASAAVRIAERAQPGVIVADPRALTPSGRDELTVFAADHDTPLITDWSDLESLLAQVEEMIGPSEPPGQNSPQLVVGSLRLDLATRVVQLGEEPLDLTAREFDLLAHFARHPGWVYSRQDLLEQVWGYDYGDPQVVTVHIANLRKKVKAVTPDHQLIETVQGIGYRLVAPPAPESPPDMAVPSDPPAKKPHRTRLVLGSVLAGVVILAGLGVGLWLGLGGGDGTAPVSGARTVFAADQSAMVRWGPQTVTEEDEQGKVLWEATWWVFARQGNDPLPGRWGSEAMDWSVTLPPPTAPPLGRNETADLLYFHLERVGDAAVATVIFRFDTTDWDHPGPPNEPYPEFVHHKFILTDNPGSQLDHVEGYAGHPAPDEVWALKFMDIDTTGVQIIYYPVSGDDANAGATSATRD
jgi:DNA-binding response OmpR family regulator